MSTKLYTAEELLDLEDDYELDEGVLVPMSRGTLMHGHVCANAHMLVGPFVRERGLGHVFINDSGFVLRRKPDTLRGPDVAFIRADRLQELPQRGWWEGAPDLAIEVLSPEDRPGQVLRKVGQYLEAGCVTVWVLDPKRRRIAIYRAEGEVEVLGDADILSGEPVLPGFSVSVAAFFA